MNIYKPTYTDDGKLCNATKWYADFRLQGRRIRFPLFSDKRASQQLADKVEKLLRVKQSGDLPDEKLLQTVEDMPEKVRERLVRLGILDARTAKAGLLLSELFDEYESVLKSRDLNPDHITYALTMLKQIAAGCKFVTWSDIDAGKLENYLKELREQKGRSYRTSNAYLGRFGSFCRWMLDNDYVPRFPAGLRKIKPLNEKKDPKRQRRAFTMEELGRLIDATLRRPLLDVETINRGRLQGQPGAKIAEETRQRAIATGRERALIYKVLFYTGLRKGELTALTVSQLRLADNPPRLILNADEEKNAKGSVIPLRIDVARELSTWLDEKLRTLQNECRAAGRAIPMQLPPETKVLNVPFGLLRIFERDRELAGIAKRDDRNRVIDVHALRTSLGTHLSRCGVNPRTAQAAMRHSDLRLTMQVYTDPVLLDVSGAFEKLPAIPSASAEGAQKLG